VTQSFGMRRTLPLMLALGLLGCVDSIDGCSKLEASHVSVYVDVIEDQYVTIYQNDGGALLIESREATDVSPNPVSVDIDVKDGAYWLVDMAVPFEDEQASWSNSGNECRRISRDEDVSSFSCEAQTGLRTTYNFSREQGLNNIKVFDEADTLISHMKLVSEFGAFSQEC